MNNYEDKFLPFVVEVNEYGLGLEESNYKDMCNSINSNLGRDTVKFNHIGSKRGNFSFIVLDKAKTDDLNSAISAIEGVLVSNGLSLDNQAKLKLLWSDVCSDISHG